MTHDSLNAPPPQLAEGDVNLSKRRADFVREHVGPVAKQLLAADERHYLHQSLSTPCLNAVTGCEGIYLIDADGRRIMDFHGNSVHQVGYSHPRVVQARLQRHDERLQGVPP